MRLSVGKLRELIHEASSDRFKRVRVGPAMGSPSKGYSIRITKNWSSFENWSSWIKLRNVLVKMGSGTEHDSWSSDEYFAKFETDASTFIDVPLRANDPETAGLEREVVVGDLEHAGFVVDSPPPVIQQHSHHPYR